jgi:hypothetical protein
VLAAGTQPQIEVRYADGGRAAIPGHELPPPISAELFARRGTIAGLVVTAQVGRAMGG